MANKNGIIVGLLVVIALLLGMPLLVCGGVFVSAFRAAGDMSTRTDAADSEAGPPTDQETEAYQTAMQTLKKSQFGRQALQFQRDDVGQLTKITHKNAPNRYSQRGLDIEIFAPDGSRPAVFCRFTYSGDDWIFFDAVTLAMEETRLREAFPRSSITRNHTAGTVMETTSTEVDEALETVLRAARPGSLTVRFHGDNYYADAQLDAADIQRVRHMLKAYEAIMAAPEKRQAEDESTPETSD